MKSEMTLTAELVARCERTEPDPGPDPGYNYIDEGDYETLTSALLRGNGSGPLWVFAYGSLMWKPEFTALEHRRATLFGWHRAFTLQLKRWRGSPQRPGLMLALERGGRCDGVIFRLPDEDHHSQLMRLIRREVSTVEGARATRWVTVNTSKGKVRALAFWVGVEPSRHAGNLTLPEVARVLVGACGHVGSGAAYLYHTVSKLEEFGIRDRNMWALQKLVADEILKMGAPAGLSHPDHVSVMAGPPQSGERR